MKRIAMILSLSLVLASLAMAETLAEWTFAGRTSPHETVNNYVSPKSGAKAAFSVDGEAVFPEGTGVFKAVVMAPSSRKNDSDIQLWCFTKKAISQGGKYRISFWAKSTQAVKAKAVFILSEAPYSQYAKPGESEFEIGSEWKLIAFNLECVKGTEGKMSRTPGFFLGNVPADTTILLANIKIESAE
ncbi:MAG: hypothetical protein HZC28_07210 [Spirochaetes bacterium]|nr:hypothetical protein [Spirochaetota bacterium]